MPICVEPKCNWGFLLVYFGLFVSQYELTYWIGTVEAERRLELLKRVNDSQSLIPQIKKKSEIPFSDSKSGVLFFFPAPSHVNVPTSLRFQLSFNITFIFKLKIRFQEPWKRPLPTNQDPKLCVPPQNYTIISFIIQIESQTRAKCTYETVRKFCSKLVNFPLKVGANERCYLTVQLEYLVGFICTAVYFIFLSPLTK